MIIEKLHIGCFGGLRDFTLELGCGINIVEGPNEAGKTTVAAFCAFILYGFEKSEKTLRLSLENSSASGYLEIKSDNKRYRIERESTPSGKDRLKTVDLTDNSLCMKGSVPGEVLLGVPAELFSHTAYISQAQGTLIDGNGVYEALENILFSGDEAVSVQKAQKRLDEARISLLHKNEKGGRIADLKKEHELLTERLYRASESNKKIILTESSLADAKEKLNENIKKRDDYELRLKYYDTDAVVRRFDNLHILQAEEAKLAAGNKKTIYDNTYKDFLPDTSYTARLKELDGEVKRLRDELNSIGEERVRHVSSEPNKAKYEDIIARIADLGGKYAILKRIDRNSRKYKFRHSSGIFLFILCICFLISAVFFFFKNNNIVYSAVTGSAAIAVLVIAVVLFKFSIVPRRDTRDILYRLDTENKDGLTKRLDESQSDEVRLKLYSERLSEFVKKNDTLASKLFDRQSELDRQLSKWGRKTVSDAIADTDEMFGKSQNGLRELENCRNAIKQTTEQLTGYDETVIRESYKTLSEAFNVLNIGEGQDKLNITALRTNYDFCCKQNTSLVERCHLLENQLTGLRAVTEKPAQLSDLIYSVDDELSSAVKRHRAYMLAHEQLAAAAEGMRSNITPNLSEESGRMLGSVTGGRYNELGIGSDMSMVYTVRGTGGSADTRSIDYMSAGTRDLAYISLRLALMSLIHRTSVPPVIFDESFARLDDRRLEMTLRLIAEYVQNGYQAILLTSQKRDAVIMNGIARFKHILL